MPSAEHPRTKLETELATQNATLRAELSALHSAPSPPPARQQVFPLKRKWSKAGVLSRGDLTREEQNLDERIRTLCLVVIALAVLGMTLHALSEVLIPFFIALALKYLLTPIIDLISCRGGPCKIKLPRGVAILLALASSVILLPCLMSLFGLLPKQEPAIQAE